MRARALAAAILLALVGAGAASASSAPAQVSRVPGSIPAGGVVVKGDFLLEPTRPRATDITAAEALAIVRRRSTLVPASQRAVLARFATLGSHGRPVRAWVVTLTSRKPVPVPGPACIRHAHCVGPTANRFNFVIDASTGAYLSSFL